jgi:hypothetical protein
MGQAHLAMAFPTQPAEPFGPRLNLGRSSPPSAQASCRWNPASRRPAVEWPGSKPTGWRTGLVAEERGGGHRKASLWWRGTAARKRRRQAWVGITGGFRAIGEDVLCDTVLGVASRRSEEGWSRLSAVAWFGQRGTMVVEWRSSRGRQQGDWWSSQCHCGARGGDEEFRGGLGWCDRTTLGWGSSLESTWANLGEARTQLTHISTIPYIKVQIEVITT